MTQGENDWLVYENRLHAQGYQAVCGVDEAGRGPLAGDVYAAAVILPPGLMIDGLNDSKKLSEKKREALFDEITAKAAAYCVATASVEEIDRLNILQATFLAMRRAIDGLKLRPDFVLIDGNQTCMIFLYYIIMNRKAQGKMQGNEFVVKTIVTTELIKAIAQELEQSRQQFNARSDALEDVRFSADRENDQENQ